jgi:hypothetical protein
MANLTQREITRHPFIAGAVILVLAPYILAYLLLFAAFYVIAAALDMLAGGHR